MEDYLHGPFLLEVRMFAYVGSGKRPKKTLQAAVQALEDGVGSARAIYDTETGELYSLSGEPTVLLTPSEYKTIKEILGICALTAAASLAFPAKTVSAMISSLSPRLGKDAVVSAAELYKLLRKKDGGSEPTGTDKAG